MKCYYHEDREAVATCCKCGKSLCKECADKHNTPEDVNLIICDDCYEKNMREEAKNLLIEHQTNVKLFIIKCVIGVVLAVIGCALFRGWGLLAFILPFGWYKSKEQSSLEKATWLSGKAGGAYVFGTIFGFILKVCLCVVLGIPYIIRDIKTLVENSKFIKDIKENGWLSE